MIYFLTTRKHGYTLRQHLEWFGKRSSERFVGLSYGDLFRRKTLPPGVYVFADLERLCPRNRDRAAHVYQCLAASNRCHLLNNPLRSLRRYDLLRALRANGLNAFRAYRLDEDRSGSRYPVFLRGEDDHKGSFTPLLHDAAAVDAAVRDARRSWKLRRANLVTEFLNTVGDDGIYRKYSAFHAGDRVIPRHLFFERTWMVKKPALGEPWQLEEEWRYVEENPHADQLAEIFRIAGIDYGRIDYGLHEGRIQTWEINTNPMITAECDRHQGSRVQVHEHFAQQLAEAFEAIDDARSSDGGSIVIDQPPRRSIAPWGSLRERIWHALYV